MDLSRATVDSCPVPQRMVELLLPNHICTPFCFTHPNLMSSVGINVQSATRSKRFFLRLLIVRVHYSELATEYQMRGETGVGMWRIIGISDQQSA